MIDLITLMYSDYQPTLHPQPTDVSRKSS